MVIHELYMCCVDKAGWVESNIDFICDLQELDRLSLVLSA